MEVERNIIGITLNEGTIVRRREEIEHERTVAMKDLLRENYFILRGKDKFNGPYQVELRICDNRLMLDITGKNIEDIYYINIPLAPFRSIIRDYFIVCENYFEAVKTAHPSHIETLDMGRRGLHDEASELLVTMLDKHVDIDIATARRFFTLMCVLHLK